MGRVINLESAGKDRTQYVRAVVLAVRELALHNAPDENASDLAAFLALALENIYNTVDASVAAWEKRGYWVKADRFRMDWDWTRRYSLAMRQAVLASDWDAIAQHAIAIAARVNGVKVPQRHKLGTPWVGAYRKILEERAG